MRPIHLSMSAFGPFSTCENIDFSQLGSNPLFLLNGPTGAGKTTILDAICFALYGKTTGDEREGGQMRCDISDEALLTEVTFEFELGTKRYRIRRVPEQPRLKKSGDGYTQQKPEAQLYQFDLAGESSLMVAAKVSEANAEIERLTGLDADQFRQVMVLPQGKFRQLLMADSKEREKIFSQLFQTHIYRRIEERLKVKAATIRATALEQKNVREGILQGAELSEESALAEQINQLGPQLEAAKQAQLKASEAYDIANKQFESANLVASEFTELEKLKVSVSALKKQQAGIQKQQLELEQALAAQRLEPADQAKAKRFNDAKNASLAQSQSQTVFAEAKQALTLAEQDFQQVAEKEQQLSASQEQLRLLESFKPLLQKQQQIERELGEAKRRLNEQELQGKGLKAKLSTLENSKSAIQQQLTSAQQQAQRQLSCQKQLHLVEQRFSQCQALAELNGKLIETQQQLEASLLRGKKLADAHQAALQQAQQIQLSWHQGQAAIIAQSLQQGQACPVCGSIEHPHLARSSEMLPTERDLELAREAEQQANQRLQEARHQHKTLTVQLNEWRTQQASLEQGLGDAAKMTLEQAQVLLQQTQQDLSLAEQAQQQVQALQTQLDQLQLEEQQLQQQIELARESYQQQKSQQDILSGQCEQAQQALPKQYCEAQLLEQALQLQGDKVSKLQQNIKQLTQRHAQAREDYSAKQSAAEAAQQALKLAQQGLLEAQQLFSQRLAESCFTNENAYNQALISDGEIANLKQVVEHFSTHFTSEQAKFEQLKSKLKGKKTEDLTLLQQQLNTLAEQRSERDALWNRLNSRQQELLAVQHKLLDADRKAEELQQQYQVIGTLADVANGNTGNKISLQRFVLSVLLDDVLLQASQRLQVMSKGRYQLIRKAQRAKGNKASGLELEVEDSYSSKLRSVATLSGGESFMAALAMALGLSDVVQAYAGGIKLDTLFIDEGFGSLDQESLDLAIRTLVDLQSAGRMVGVISHVVEMKEQIATRIDVLKTASGSHTQLVLP
ncbi:AAA family ATPase [Agarivorans sp. QJM3NY_29]|uniref:AAA family ATPase n=1 Tax=unclassified Agarivorans TaxID=2636026 RepID=UPI003D7E2ACC